MKKKLIALLLLVTCSFCITSCAVVPAYDASELIPILDRKGYDVEMINEVSEEGISVYLYANNPETGEKLFYIYCEDIRSAQSIYRYINSQRKAKIAEIKMEIEKVEYSLYKGENSTAAQKGDYYEKYLLLKEQLDEVQNYGCGRGLNVVWYGTKQAIMDIRLG